MSISERRTKIVCTLGPSSNTEEKIDKLVRNGMNIARINFSHGTHEDNGKVIQNVRRVADRYGVSLPVIADLQGPKIRIGTMKDGGQQVKSGDYVTLTTKDIEGTSETIPVDYKGLISDAVEGNRLLIDDGLLELKVIKKNESSLVAQVVVGGLLKSRKGLNLPDVDLSMASLTKKDIKDLEYAVSQDVDYVAMSFVRTADDIQEVISRVRAKGSNAGIIAKIEKPEAITVIDDIIEESSGIMVARGDLGIEIASEKVPMVQKNIIDKCRQAGKPVITATQMLDSMIENPRPTRAESSDVANAVLDGTDAVMLSGETAAGEYPVEAVKTMDKICGLVEKNADHIYNSLEYRKPEWKEKQVIESLAYSCVMLAENVDARVISTITHSGSTARRIAKFRPRVPIVAFTESDEVRQQLGMVWGVQPIKIDEIFDTDKSVKLMEEHLKNHGFVNRDDRAIIATGMPIAKKGRTNMIKVSTID
ncbi:pyruvate kinase [Fodinibius sp. AD559]|uniref:pyruvate kinase n=1 Tax=Fodinibius sp. AD559 TaxID=3424179 RepID=UPI0040469256